MCVVVMDKCFYIKIVYRFLCGMTRRQKLSCFNGYVAFFAGFYILFGLVILPEWW